MRHWIGLDPVSWGAVDAHDPVAGPAEDNGEAPRPRNGIKDDQPGLVWSFGQDFFEKFLTSWKQKGSGLGTYSPRMIAKMHGPPYK